MVSYFRTFVRKFDQFMLPEEEEQYEEYFFTNTASPKCLMKHPLQSTWTLWYLESDRSKSWNELQNAIMSFNTVEDFWSLYNQIKLPSEIKGGSDYSLFRKGIKPMWEDEANKKGGRWIITLNKHERYTHLDKLWLDVILHLIGEAFVNSDHICGAVVSARNKGDKISIWTSDGKKEDAALEIAHKIKQSLGLDTQEICIVYQLHKDTMLKQNSGGKVAYTH